jgi:hypothetical protein
MLLITRSGIVVRFAAGVEDSVRYFLALNVKRITPEADRLVLSLLAGELRNLPLLRLARNKEVIMFEFLGTAVPLTSAGVSKAASQMGVTAPQLWAVLAVETNGCGFLADRRPEILFEHHVFQRLTHNEFDARAPDLSNDKKGGYGAAGANQYSRLERAIGLDREAALKSTSWGIAQVMGFNAEKVGFSSPQDMVTAMMASEDNQLQAMVGFILDSGLQESLAANDFPSFARGFNGPDFRQNMYDTRLASAHAKFLHGGLPDLAVRSAQVLLLFLGHAPGPIDGVVGRRTRSALNDFQGVQGLLPTDNVTDEVLTKLQGAVARLPR